MGIKEVIATVNRLLGSSNEVEIDMNDPDLAEFIIELRKAKVRLPLTQEANPVSVSLPPPTSGNNICRISRLGGAKAPVAAPVSDPAKKTVTPSPRPMPKRHQHTYVAPAMAKDMVSIMADPASIIIQLVGPTGCGKSTLVNFIVRETGRKVYQINCRGDMGSESFLGEKTIAIDQATKQNVVVYLKGVVEQAMIEGLDDNGQEVGAPAILFIDEITACPASVGHVLNRLFESDDPRRTIVLDQDGGRVVRSHSGLRIIVAGNTAGRGATDSSQTLYTAQLDALDISLLSRVAATVRMGYDKRVEKNILTEKIGDDRVCTLICKYRDAIRGHIKAGKLTTPFTTRNIVSIADMFRIFGSIQKAIYLAVIEKLLPEEQALYNETAVATFGSGVLMTVDPEIDYM